MKKFSACRTLPVLFLLIVFLGGGAAAASEAMRLDHFIEKLKQDGWWTAERERRLHHTATELQAPPRSDATTTLAGGRIANLGNLPSTAYLKVRFVNRITGKFWASSACTGVIVQKALVLTAAHCVLPENAEDILDEISVFYGYVDQESHEPEPKAAIVKNAELAVAIHSGFELDGSEAHNDLAVILLPQPIVEQPEVSEVALLAGAKTKTLPWHFFHMTGWGLTAVDGGSTLVQSTKLLYALVEAKDAAGKKIEPADLDDWFALPIISAGTFADDRKATTCPGDSGSGFFDFDASQLGQGTLRLLGITSFGRDLDKLPTSEARTCAHPRISSDFMNLLVQRAFLNEAASLLGQNANDFRFDD